MKKILITGAAGFIGSSLADKILYRKDAVVASDHYSIGNRVAVMLGMPFWGRNVNKLTNLPMSSIFFRAECNFGNVLSRIKT